MFEKKLFSSGNSFNVVAKEEFCDKFFLGDTVTKFSLLLHMCYNE